MQHARHDTSQTESAKQPVSNVTCFTRKSDACDGGRVTVAVSGRGRKKSTETRHMVQSSAEPCSKAGVHPTVNNGVVAGM